MKLLFGIKALDVPGGGAERVLTVVASGLAQRRHDVAVVTFDAPGGTSFYPVNPDVKRICLGLGPTDGKTGMKSFAQRLPVLRRAVREEQPDVVVGFMHSMFVPLALGMIGTGIPLVASEHIVPEHYEGRRTEYALFQLGCLMSKRVTVLSEAVRDLYPRILRRRMVPMSNPVVVHEDCKVDVVGENRPQKTVLSVGRLEAQKDHATLIRAFASVANEFPDWNLRIVGDGSLRRDLERLVSELGLEERVSLPGSTDRIDAEYSRAQLLAVPSRFESFGLVTAEALAVGLPVLGFAGCPGTNELIQHDVNGWLVGDVGEPERVNAYQEALATLIADGNLRVRLGDAGRRSMRGSSPENVVRSWEQLLCDVTGGVG
jgi:glycosyltransferase involved in cell wall biosynthesis